MSEYPNNRAHLLSTLKEFRTVMLLTCDCADAVEARPMTVVSYDESGVLWFPVSRSSENIRSGSEAYVIAQSDNRYVVAHGEPSIDFTPATIAKLWRESLKVWYPGGTTDPELAFLRFQVTDGEYWDISGLNKIRYYLSAFNAYITHTQPDVMDDSYHAKVSLEGK